MKKPIPWRAVVLHFLALPAYALGGYVVVETTTDCSHNLWRCQALALLGGLAVFTLCIILLARQSPSARAVQLIGAVVTVSSLAFRQVAQSLRSGWTNLELWPSGREIVTVPSSAGEWLVALSVAAVVIIAALALTTYGRRPHIQS
jgi:hypothetical protein